MKILAIETVTEKCSVALLDGEIFSLHGEEARKHPENVIAFAEKLFAKRGLSLQDLDAIAVDVGPGSFTGVRVGISMAQAMAFAQDIPTLAVSSLRSMLEMAPDPEPGDTVVAALDARMAQVYWCAWRCTGAQQFEQLGAPMVQSPETVTVADAGKLICLGPGFSSYSTLLAKTRAECEHSMAVEIYPDAGALLKVAARDFAAGGGIPAQDLAPLYVRDNVALKKQDQLRNS